MPEYTRYPGHEAPPVGASTNGAGSEEDRAPMRPHLDEDGCIVWDRFFGRDRNDTDWVVEDVLARARGHAIWARGGNGKSEFAQWVALEAARGGHVVVYLDYEMNDDDVEDRFSDFGADKDRTGLDRLVYRLLTDLPPLNRPDGAEALGAFLDKIAARFGETHIVVVIDTIGRAVVGEENSNDTIMDFYRYAGSVLRTRGCTWVRLDHTGHEAEHARGGSAKRDDVDIVWKHERTDGGCKLIADKRRTSWVPERVNFDRQEAPILRYVNVPLSWPAGTQDTAEKLSALHVPINTTVTAACKALREAESGRRTEVVRAAVKWRQVKGASNA